MSERDFEIYMYRERESKIDEKPVKDTEGQAEQVKHRIQGERAGGGGGGGIVRKSTQNQLRTEP